jgi:hypothetical protein
MSLAVNSVATLLMPSRDGILNDLVGDFYGLVGCFPFEGLGARGAEKKGSPSSEDTAEIDYT